MGEIEIVRFPIGDEYHIVAIERAFQALTGCAHPPLSPIAPYRIPKLLSRNESNTAGSTVLLFILQHQQHVRAAPEPRAFIEDAGYIRAGFDNLQHELPRLTTR